MEKPVLSVFQFDKLVQCYNILLDSSCEKEFLRFISNQEILRVRWIETINECKQLQARLDAANKENNILNHKLSTARRWLDSEKLEKKKLELEKNALVQKLDDVRCILLNDSYYKLSAETREKLSFLRGILPNSPNQGNLSGCKRMKSFSESNSNSDLSDVDISVSRSGDDLDDVLIPTRRNRKSHISSVKSSRKERTFCAIPNRILPVTPCRESNSSSDKAPGYMEYEKENRFPGVKRIGSRAHNFICKTFLLPEYCSWCAGKVGFRHTAMKCSECNIITHLECSDKTPLPCAPAMATPVKNSCLRFISDYAPSSAPMVPSIVIRCVREIESRGLDQAGLYRIPGIKSCVRVMNQKFSLDRDLPNLKDFDVHSICHFLLNFLQNLHDPIIPRSKLMMFAEAITGENKNYQLCSAISSLPQANRDTLAFIVLHLQNVASAPKCKMSASNLATVFGSVMIGCLHDEQLGALIEKHTADTIMEELILFPAYYWSRFIGPSLSENNRFCITHHVQSSTPCRILMTPNSRKKFFNTSPPVKD